MFSHLLSCILSLFAGWNLITVDVETPLPQFASEHECVTAVWYFDQGLQRGGLSSFWRAWFPNQPASFGSGPASLQVLVPGAGYWVFSTCSEEDDS